MNYQFLFIPIALASAAPTFFVNAYAIIISGHCEKNISVKYQVPVTRIHPSPVHSANDINTHTYVEYEDRIRWDTVQLCCPGYRTIIFGLCEPICNEACPQNSYCMGPNKCECKNGYEPSHHPNKEHQLICRPTCNGGCPKHGYCIAHNHCECRPGFKDTSAWFAPMRCEKIHCPAADQRYDVIQRTCVKIEMSFEELMQEVGEVLNGTTDSTDYMDISVGDDDDDHNATAAIKQN